MKLNYLRLMIKWVFFSVQGLSNGNLHCHSSLSFIYLFFFKVTYLGSAPGAYAVYPSLITNSTFKR